MVAKIGTDSSVVSIFSRGEDSGNLDGDFSHDFNSENWSCDETSNHPQSLRLVNSSTVSPEPDSDQQSSTAAVSAPTLRKSSFKKKTAENIKNNNHTNHTSRSDPANTNTEVVVDQATGQPVIWTAASSSSSSSSSAASPPTQSQLDTPPKQQRQQEQEQQLVPVVEPSPSPPHQSRKPPRYPAGGGLANFINSPTHPSSSSKQNGHNSSKSVGTDYPTNNDGDDQQQQQTQHRRRKSAPPGILGIEKREDGGGDSKIMAHLRRLGQGHGQINTRTPFDESSEEPSDASTQHAVQQPHPIFQVTSSTSQQHNNRSQHPYHPNPQQTQIRQPCPPQQTQQRRQPLGERDPPQQQGTWQPLPPQKGAATKGGERWDSSDRNLFPTMDIQRMKNKLMKLRASSSGTATRSSSTSSDQAHAGFDHDDNDPESQQFPSQTASSSAFYSDTSSNPFATTITSSFPHPQPPLQSKTQSKPSSSFFSESAYNPFVVTSSGSGSDQEGTNNSRTVHRPSKAAATSSSFNPFAALVAAVSPDPTPTAAKTTNQTMAGATTQPSSNRSQDGSQSSGGSSSRISGQSVRRRRRSHNNKSQDGRIWTKDPQELKRQDSLDMVSLGDSTSLTHESNIIPEEEHDNKDGDGPLHRGTSSAAPQKPSSSSSSAVVEQSLRKSFHRKGRRRQENSSSPPTVPTTNEQYDSNSSGSGIATTAGNKNLVKKKQKKSIMYPVQVSDMELKEDDDDIDDDDDEQEGIDIEPDFTLHDLCGEASSTDDVAWRNALYLLSVQPELAFLRDNIPDSASVIAEQDEMDEAHRNGDDNDDNGDNMHAVGSRLSTLEERGEEESEGQGWTPLHISCLGIQPPPTFIIRGLLYANPKAVKWRDDGGRLPLHLVAASSADVPTMELLLQAWPQAISKCDHKGLTPLHLLLRNKSVVLTPENTSVLLGLSSSNNPSFLNDSSSSSHWQRMNKLQQRFILQRRGQHLNMTLKEIDAYIARRKKPVATVLHPDYDEVDEEWNTYPPDVQAALRQLVKWRNKFQQVQAQKSKGKNGKNRRKQEANEPTIMQYLCDEDEDLEDIDDILSDTINPAAIPHYSDLKLPIHLAVSRGIVQPVALEDPMIFSDEEDDDDEEYSDSDQEVETQPKKPRQRKPTERPQRSSVDDICSVLRCIISAFPEGLCVRDADGKTPLLHVMTMTNGLPTTEMIELLLGKRCGAFDEIPPWLSGLPLHSISSLPECHSRILSPAMVASSRTNQLPLHIAAEEFLSNTEVIETIYKSYPAAVDVQDHRGRTPLHLVFSNYCLFPASPEVISMLLSETSAKCRDVDGNLPFDMLVQIADSLPKRLPDSWEAGQMAQIYQRFFTASLLTSPDEERRSNSTEFLHQLRLLPTWLRRQACSVAFVQELIIEELSSPWRTACVVLDGLLLIIILVLFRVEVKNFTGSVTGISNQGEQPINEGYPALVGTAVAVRIFMLNVRVILAASISQLNYLILFNGWFWVDLSAMIMTFITTFGFNSDRQVHSVLTMATAATGLLWLSVVGYCATWFFGMSLLLGSLAKIANQIFWPILTGGMLLIAFAQMFYTLLWTDCVDAIPMTPVCSVRDSYRVVYLLLRGEPLVELDGAEEISVKAVSLVSIFLIAIFLLFMAVAVSVIMGALHTNTEEVAYRSFWEPKLAFVISSVDWGFHVDRKLSIKPSRKADLQFRLERTWDLLISSLVVGTPPRTDKFWYAGCHRIPWYLAWAFWTTAMIAVPVWFALGLLTLGVLWPPQLRRLIYQPFGWENSRSPSPVRTKSDYVASQLSNIQSDLTRTKTMTYERTVQVENEVRAVKHLLYAAVREE